MELIRGSNLNMPKVESNPAHSLLSREESEAQATVDSRLRIDALISLLVEKGIVTRDEIVSMIYQKKMGL
jgi:hypothetical protein